MKPDSAPPKPRLIGKGETLPHPWRPGRVIPVPEGARIGPGPGSLTLGPKLRIKLPANSSHPPEAVIWKTADVSKDRLHHLIVNVIYPTFAAVRASEPMDGFEGEIQALPPLDLTTRAAWARVIARWMAAGQALAHPDTMIQRHANPARTLGKRKNKAQKRLKARYSGELGPIEATHKMMWERKIYKISTTPADLRHGLAETLSARLKSLLKS